MRKYLKSMFVLWRAPKEVKEKAEKAMQLELDRLPQNLHDKANQLRGKKEWKILLALKVESVLAHEEVAQMERDLDRLNPGLKSGSDTMKAVGDQIAANQALADARLRVLLVDPIFTAEWGAFITTLISRK